MLMKHACRACNARKHQSSAKKEDSLGIENAALHTSILINVIVYSLQEPRYFGHEFERKIGSGRAG
jgi:hypothetical protein